MSQNEKNPEMGLSILVVCKDEDRFLPAVQRLGEQGHATESATSVYRAVASFARRPADVAIVDLDSLENAESECVRIFRKSNKDVYIVAVFSQEHRQKAAEALGMGADASLQQPFYAAELVSMITRWAERAIRLRDAQKDHLDVLQRLAGGMAHEINNPLTTLCGWLEMMELDEGRDAEKRERLASIRREALRIAQVVKYLSAFAQGPPEERSLVDMNAVVSGLVEDICSRATGVQVETRLTNEAVTVWGNHDLLRQASQILLEHSVDAPNGSGTLVVQTRLTADNLVELVVRDKDRCVPNEQLERIFQPYGSVSCAGEGTSLACPAAHGIIRSHGGEVCVTSDEERGTEFLVWLPGISTAS